MKFLDMLQYVLPSAAGCPDSLAVQHLVRAARRFCSETLAWNYQTEPISSTAGLAKYTLQIGRGQELVRLIACEVNGANYLVPSGAWGRSLQRRGAGNTCVVDVNQDINLTPSPYVDGMQIVTDIAVRPAIVDPADWPDDLSEHVNDIADGALATLLILPKTTWFESGAAGEKEQRFKSRISTVGMKVSKGSGRSRIGAAVRWF